MFIRKHCLSDGATVSKVIAAHEIVFVYLLTTRPKGEVPREVVGNAEKNVALEIVFVYFLTTRPKGEVPERSFVIRVTHPRSRFKRFIYY